MTTSEQARQEPTTVTLGGITYDDPYAWLEDDTEDVLAWQESQNRRALEYIDAWPAKDLLEEQITPLVADLSMTPPRKRGAHWFRRDEAKAGARITVASDPAAEGRVLVDAATIENEAGTTSIDWFYPSPDGRLVAYGLSFGGDEQSVLHVIEVESGRVLDDRIPFTSVATVAWLPDSSGFWYNAGLVPDFENSDKHLFFHRIGQEKQSEREPLTVREPYCVFPQVSADGRYVAALTSEMDVRPDFVKRLPDGEWTPFLEGIEAYAFGEFVGDDYIAVSMHGAPRGRLVRIPVDTAADTTTWEELLPESDVVLRYVVRAGDHLVLLQYRDAYAEIRLLDLSGQPVAEVEMPGRGAVLAQPYQVTSPIGSGLPIETSTDGFTFVFSSLTQSPGLYRYDIESRRLEDVVAPRHVRDDLVTEDRVATATDGAEVHYTIVRRADVSLDEPRPAAIYGYGGWNIAFVPSSMGEFGPFVDAGGVFVHAHLRGGGEFGEEFWRDGRLERKQHSFDDLYAIAESLIEAGVTDRDHLAVVGGSNGGLLTGAALTQRPDLFGVIVTLVGLYDMMKFQRDGYTSVCDLEYGDPNDPEEAQWLFGYSPYHNVREAAYPATLAFVGTNDMRCLPWHARKLMARVQDADTGDRPLLLRAAEDCGHGTVFFDPKRVAEWMGFLMKELGLEPVAESR